MSGNEGNLELQGIGAKMRGTAMGRWGCRWSICFGDDDDADDDGGDDGGDDFDNEKSTYGGFFSLCGVPRLPCEHLLVSSDKGLRVNDDTF